MKLIYIGTKAECTSNSSINVSDIIYIFEEFDSECE